MATGAYDSADSSVLSDGKRITLSFATPGGDGWTLPVTIATSPSLFVSIAVDTGGPNARTVNANMLSGTPSVTGTDLRITFSLTGIIRRNETCRITITDSGGDLIQDSSVTPDVNGTTSGTTLTNSSGFVGLASLDTLKSNLGVTTSTDDEFMANLLSVATRRIEVYCGRDRGGFISQSWTETIDGDGTGEIALRNRPVTAIASVKSIDSEGTETTLDSSSYRRDQRVGIVHRIDDEDSDLGFISGGGGHNGIVFRWPAQFERGNQNLSVTYTGGYTPSNLPEDLQWAAIQIASDLYRAKKIDGNLASESIGQHSYSLRTPTERSEEFERLLAPYVRWTVA